MELSLILRWIIFSTILGIIAVLLAFSLVYIVTRLCFKRRVEHTHGASVSGEDFWSGTRGVDPSVIDTFPKFTYDVLHGRRQCHGMLVCVICLAVFKEDETLRSMPKCGHVFHSECVGSWLKTHATCPCCRANLVPKPDGSGSGSGILGVLPAGLVGMV